MRSDTIVYMHIQGGTRGVVGGAEMHALKNESSAN